MENPSLFQAFQQSVERHADLTAIKSDRGEISYRELEAIAREVGAGLMKLGIERGDRVAIWGVNSEFWVQAGLGLQAAGAALVPVGTRLRGREASGILVDSGAKIVFTDRAFGSFDFVETLLAQDLPDVAKIVVLDGDAKPGEEGRVISLDQLRALGGELGAGKLDERIAGGCGDDLADILFTSGTTGKPKGVPMLQYQSLYACHAQQREISFFTPDDVFAVTYPFAHNAGYRAGWQVSLLFGVKIIPVATFDAGELLRMIDREKLTIMPVAPPIAQGILDHPDRAQYSLDSVRYIATGGTTVPVKLIKQIFREFGPNTRVSNGYGLTEAAGSVTTSMPDDPPELISVSIGKKLECLDVKIVDPEGNEVPHGEQGEIAVRGVQVMKGYYNNPEATAKSFTEDGFLLTGDVGSRDEDGNFYITDRVKDMYLVGGFNCYPAEIEHMMYSMPGIKEVAVIGVDDERLGQVGRAYVVRETGSTIDEAEIIAWCRKEMANYKAPRTVCFTDALPRNAMGKIAKQELHTLD